MPDLATLRVEFTDLHTKATATIAKATTEGRELSTDEQKETDTQFARMEQIQKIEKNNAKLAEFAFNKGTVEKPSNAPGQEEADAVEIKVGNTFDGIKTKAGQELFMKAANQWLATGQMDRRFTTINTGTGSGIILPKDILPLLAPTAQNTLRAALQAYGMTPLQTPTTRAISWPVATANAGATLAETATSDTENEPAITGINLTPAVYSSNFTFVSNLELLAVDFDFLAALAPDLIYAKELAFESGVLTALSNDSTITQTVNTATDSTVTYANLVALHMALPKRYASQRVIILNKAVYTAFEELVSTTGQPILTPDVQNSELKRFQGTPVLWTDYLSGYGTSGKVVGFCTSLMGFKVRDCDGTRIERYLQYPGKPDQTGFVCFGYHAAGYDINAVSTLVCP